MMRELKQALLDIEFLQECNNSVNLALSVTRKELAAAKAELAAERTSHEKAESDLLEQVIRMNGLLAAEREKREQADENLAWLLQAYCDECDYDSEICRGTRPEMQCAARTLDESKGAAIITRLHRMEGALREIAACKTVFNTEVPYIVDKNGVCICESEITDIAKAALEDKP